MYALVLFCFVSFVKAEREYAFVCTEKMDFSDGVSYINENIDGRMMISMVVRTRLNE